MDVKKRRDELARYYYGEPYSNVCWLRQGIIDNRIDMEITEEREQAAKKAREQKAADSGNRNRKFNIRNFF
ncbi:MAG: hypothetical protein WC565_00175 [Parcubacteria group bacterium]